MPRRPRPPADPPAPLDPDRTPEPYERLPKETEKQWAAFVAYRDTPTGKRSLRDLCGDKPGLIRQYERWSSTHRWVARCAAWDAALDDRTRQARLDLIDRQAERQQATAAILMSKLMLRVNAIDPSAIPPRAIAALLVAAAKVEREALGVPTGALRVSHDAGTTDSGDPIPLLEWLAGRVAGDPDEGAA